MKITDASRTKVFGFIFFVQGTTATCEGEMETAMLLLVGKTTPNLSAASAKWLLMSLAK